jgi:Homing endonuclease associated repeat
MAATPATDLLLVSFHALSVEEQEEAFERISQARLERLAGEESESARFLRSLLRISEHLGHPENLTSTAYRKAWRELRGGGEEVENLHSVIRHYGSWRRAREALELSKANSARKIEARFDKRRLDKIWCYTEETLKEVVARCVKALGHVPRLAEYEHWRNREIELAEARGDDAFHLPSSSPFRRLWGSWGKALLALGYSPSEIARRLEA